MNLVQLIKEEIELQDNIKNLITKLTQLQSSQDTEINTLLNSIIVLLSSNKIEDAFKIYWNSSLKTKFKSISNEFKDIKVESYIEKELDSNWCLNSGIFTAWRAGVINKENDNGVFFTIDKKGAIAYSNNGTRPVRQFKLKINNPLIAKHFIEALAFLTNKSEDYFIELRNNTSDSKFQLKMDILLKKLAVKNGYDAITYTNPLPPAIKEVVLFNVKNIKEIN